MTAVSEVFCPAVHQRDLTLTVCGKPPGHPGPHVLGEVEWWDNGRAVRRTVDGDVVGMGYRNPARTIRAPRTSAAIIGDRETLGGAAEPTPDDDIQARFLAYHRANPWVYDRLVSLARQEVSRGNRRIGIGKLTEVLRWEHGRRTTDASSPFRMSNDYRSRYARFIMEQEPDLRGCFALRELRSS